MTIPLITTRYRNHHEYYQFSEEQRESSAKAQHDRETQRQTDDRQSDPYVALCFAGAKINFIFN